VRRLAAVTLLTLTLAAPFAHANGDPASDVLLQAKIYFPTQKVSVEEARKLHNVVNSANAKGYPIRVALIKDESDLGTVPNLLNHPQQYADFLGPEIRFAYRGDLLVVMPNGLGVMSTDQSAPPADAVKGMQVEAGGSPDGMAQTAQEAVAALSAAAGHPLAAAKKKGGGSGALIGVLVAVALVGVAIGAAYWARRTAPQADTQPPAAS
jgi:hypothetical protein